MLFLRAIKRRFFENKQFNNYLLYALGETVLLVVGILIALYINNWNNEKQRQQTLQSYIKIISQNIQDDLIVVERVRQSRAAAYESAVRVQAAMSDKVSFTRKEFWDIAQALGDARALYSFTPNTSGYEALKSSGYLSNLQGSDIESVLYDYYDTVNRLLHKEANHNAYVRGLGLQIVSIWPKTLFAWELGQSSAITDARLLALQPEVTSLLGDPNTREVLAIATWVFELMQDYQILKRLGKTLVNMNNKGIVDFDAASLALFNRNDVPSKGMGNPNVIVDGQISWHSYAPTSASADDIRLSAKRDINNRNKAITEVRFDSFKDANNSVHIAYPGGAEWAGLWFFIPVDGSADFSRFDTLFLELKGDIGGETFLLNLEDINDPTDGSTTRIELTLTDQWQPYELNLADFKTADLTQLKVATGFVFGQTAQSFSVRTIKYMNRNEKAL